MKKNNENPNSDIKKAAALKYNMEKDNAPKIIAKGKGELAKKIVETAEEHDIPIRKDQDIVEVLTRMNIGEEIPEKLYSAIAEILSFIYQMENKEN